MRRIITIALLSFGITTAINSQNIVPFKKEGKEKWGYRDSETLTEVYSAKLQMADTLKDGCARVMQKNRYGIINKAGEFVVKPIYTQMEDAPDGRYKVSKGGLWGYISSRTGKEIIPIKYSSIGAFTLNTDSLAEATIINSKGEKSYGYITWSGKERIPVKYAYIGTFDSNEYAWANYLGGAGKNNTVYKGYHTIVSREHGVILPDRTYFKLISPIEVRERDDAAKAIAKYDSALYNSPITIFNANQTSIYDRYIGSPIYQDKDGYYFFTKSYINRAGVVHISGTEVIPDGRFDRVSIPVGDYAVVANLDRQNIEFQHYIYNTKSGEAKPVMGGLCGAIVDETVLVAEFERNREGKITDTKFRYYNTDGTLLGHGLTAARNFSNGLGICNRYDTWGAIDKNGEVKIPFNYNYLGSIDSKGYILAKNLNNEVGFINTTLETLIPFEYTNGTEFKNSLAKVYKGYKCGLIDYNNNIVLDFEWRDILPPSTPQSKIAWVCDDNFKWYRYDIATNMADKELLVDKVIKQDAQGFTVVKRGSEYAIIADNDGAFLMPFESFKSEEKLLKIYNYYTQLGFKDVKKIDILRYLIREKQEVENYSIKSVIEESNWDY